MGAWLELPSHPAKYLFSINFTCNDTDNLLLALKPYGSVQQSFLIFREMEILAVQWVFSDCIKKKI
jgi:hypothetical protein